LIATSPGKDLKSAKIASDETAPFCAAKGRAKGIVPIAAAAPVKKPRRELNIFSPQFRTGFSDVFSIARAQDSLLPLLKHKKSGPVAITSSS
jgi:hypothetical protein